MAVVACSFCGKSQHAVAVIVAGPRGAFICNECVDLGADIVAEHRERREAQAAAASRGADTPEARREWQAMRLMRLRQFATSEAAPAPPVVHPQRQTTCRLTAQCRGAFRESRWRPPLRVAVVSDDWSPSRLGRVVPYRLHRLGECRSV
jgi:hypothetical protein